MSAPQPWSNAAAVAVAAVVAVSSTSSCNTQAAQAATAATPVVVVVVGVKAGSRVSAEGQPATRLRVGVLPARCSVTGAHPRRGHTPTPTSATCKTSPRRPSTGSTGTP